GSRLAVKDYAKEFVVRTLSFLFRGRSLLCVSQPVWNKHRLVGNEDRSYHDIVDDDEDDEH
ncbi:unnamed protein product, partial [Amoebophrya sp. A25]